MAKIYWESLEQLSQNDPKTWNIVMLNVKLFIEEMAESKAHYLEKFEMKRHVWGGDTDMVVLEGFCNSCRIFFIAPMKTMDYIKYLDKSRASGTPESNIMCDVCKKGYIDFLWYIDRL
jgi:hypothetical protein